MPFASEEKGNKMEVWEPCPWRSSLILAAGEKLAHSLLAEELLPSFGVDYCLDISGTGFFEPADQSFKAFADGGEFIAIRREHIAFNISDFMYDGHGANWPHEIQQSSKTLATLPNFGPLLCVRVGHLAIQPLAVFYASIACSDKLQSIRKAAYFRTECPGVAAHPGLLPLSQR
jgi:hypothetical protein